ncbi:hypothetical protein EYF80_005844 [Liparis tanakae]|uniref:Uncharacterized protein n=1 Tax=Liparis tanakae TaxID=230148 RepID=A0A4Z2J3B0_9TELE|nr:hypothetical protein EYF80_005844 [Liparis tanakae]
MVLPIVERSEGQEGGQRERGRRLCSDTPYDDAGDPGQKGLDKSIRSYLGERERGGKSGERERKRRRERQRVKDAGYFQVLTLHLKDLVTKKVQSDGVPEVIDLNKSERAGEDGGEGGGGERGRKKKKNKISQNVGMQQYVAIRVDGKGVAIGSKLRRANGASTMGRPMTSKYSCTIRTHMLGDGTVIIPLPDSSC